jgi:hypothetical protein
MSHNGRVAKAGGKGVGRGCYRSGGERSCLRLVVGLFGVAERADVMRH